MRLARLSLLLLSATAAEADAACDRSGFAAPPPNTTLAADTSNSNAAVVVTPACDETAVAIGGTQFETSLTVEAMAVVRVASYPRVHKLLLGENQIESFTATSDQSLLELDLNNNRIGSLDSFQFPSSLETLVLSDNRIKSTRTAQFPTGLKLLLMAKNGISTLDLYDFPPRLKNLQLDGNDIATLKGAVLPDALESFSCMNCRITVIEGVRFPSTLQKFLVSGATVTTFIARESDVAVLAAAQLSFTSSVSTDCPKGGKWVETAKVCAMPDAEFDTTYPKRVAVTKSSSSTTGGGASSTSPQSPSIGGDSGGDSSSSTTASPARNADTTANTSSSHSTTYLLVGILVFAAIAVGVIIGFVVQRRGRKSLRASDLRELLAEAATTHTSTNKGGSGGATATGRSVTMGIEVSEPLPPNSRNGGGFYLNDVRNDEELLPYRLPKGDLTIVRELATGGFGVVYLAQFFDDTVVVKQIVATKVHSTAILKRFMDEIRLSARLDHPKIARFIGLSWTTLQDLSLVMEFVPNGDLHALLRANRALPNGRDVFTWFSDASQPRSKTLIALDIVEALVYLHSFEPRIIHRDLKAKNVLLARDWTAKLADFGVSREAAQDTMTGGMGTTAWIAPEVLQGERYSEKADIYSFGIVLSELDTCGHPYNSKRTEGDSLTDPKIAVLVSTDAIKPTIEADCPLGIREVILSCVEFHAARRPSALDLHFRLRSIRAAYLAQGLP